MRKRPSSTTDLVVAAAALLGRQRTTRLISELTDHGPAPLGELAGIFCDLTHDQYSHGLRALRERGLIAYGKDQARDCYVLTAAGQELGDVYDALSRWARAHAFPTEQCTFPSRIEETLRLLKDRDLLTILASARPALAGELDAETERSLTASGFMYVMRDGEALLTAAGQALRGPLGTLASWARAHPDLLHRQADVRPGLHATISGPTRRAPARRSA
jgi:DNA-binding HxlR family transcriptional regulator